MRFVDMYHPELEAVATVPEISVDTHTENGWLLLDDDVDARPDVTADDLQGDGEDDPDIQED